MMRKLVSVFLAVASLVCTTSSLAATSTGELTSGSRNDISVMETEQANATDMPAFRGGDTIEFNIEGLTNGNILTIISYEYNNPEDLSDATIQYIDQYKIDSATKTVSYIVRETTKDGIYKLSFSENDESEIVDFYYKVGNPVFAMIPGETKNYWNIEKHESGYAVGFVAKAVIESNEVSLEDVGVTNLGFTFKFTANGEPITRTLTQEQFNAISTAQKYGETVGKVAFVYGVTVYGIDSESSADAISAEVYHQDN